MCKWISVKDELPGTSITLDKFIVYSNSVDWEGIIPVWVFFSQKIGWWFNMGTDIAKIRDVTHWMPFPEPPEEAKDE